MRGFAVAAGVAFLLSVTPASALAHSDEVQTATADAPDPGIAALHEAITDLRDANASLKAECPDRSDAKCRAQFAKARADFKAAREKAIAEHHAFKEDQKKAREAARDELKAETAKKAPKH